MSPVPVLIIRRRGLRVYSGTFAPFTVAGANTYGTAINERGDIAGYADTGNGSTSNFLRVNGAVTTFTVPGAFEGFSETNGINDSDKVVGYYITEPRYANGFYRTADGTLTPFGVSDAPANGIPEDINDTGLIVGRDGSYEPTGPSFVVAGGGYTTFSIGSSVITRITGINNYNQFIGYTVDTNSGPKLSSTDL